MTNRAAKLLSGLFISGLAAISLAAGPNGAAKAADDCLAAPKSQAPQGTHWYYRIDRTTKRHCWYVRDENKGSQQASAPPAQPGASQTSATLQKSVADARAELPAAAEPEERTPATPLTEIPDATNSANVAGDSKSSSSGGWILASRWSNHADADSASTPMQAADAAAVKQQLQAAATKPPAEREGSSVWALIAALAGALAVAGIATAAIARRASNRSTDREARHESRQAIWSYDAGEETPVAPTGDEPVMNWVRIARETQEAQNPGREVEQLLARTRWPKPASAAQSPHLLAKHAVDRNQPTT